MSDVERTILRVLGRASGPLDLVGVRAGVEQSLGYRVSNLKVVTALDHLRKNGDASYSSEGYCITAIGRRAEHDDRVPLIA